MRELLDLPDGCTLGLVYTSMHDSAIAVLGPDGATRFACALERISRVKQDGRWPQALLDRVPFDRIALTAVGSLGLEEAKELAAAKSLSEVPLRARQRVFTKEPIAHPDGWDRHVGALPGEVAWFDHHECHAASAYWPSGFDRALVLTCDAGAHQSPWHTAIYTADGDELRLEGGVNFGTHVSPAHLYTAVTALLGLRPSRHEGKVTGLAARGRVSEVELARFADLAWPMAEDLGRLVHWDFCTDVDFAPTIVVNHAVRDEWRARLGFLTDEQLAACVQRIAERSAVDLVERARELAGEEYPAICLAGGFFSNVRVNQVVVESGFERGFVAPPMTDDGVALGAALLGHVRVRGLRVLRRAGGGGTMFLGPHIDERAAADAIAAAELEPESVVDVAHRVAELLAEGRVVGVARGAMEFGPRALGHRSVLAPATDPAINDWLNAKLHRTEYMPFAPMLLREDVEALLVGVERIADTARFMTITADCTDAMRAEAPAAVHVDGTARPQIVDDADDPFCASVLRAYREITGRRAIINTSFNVHEEPIVCSAEDALRGFARTRLDWLVLGDVLIEFERNAEPLERVASERPDVAGNLPIEEAMSRWQSHTQERLEATTRDVERVMEVTAWHAARLQECGAALKELNAFVEQLKERQRQQEEAAAAAEPPPEPEPPPLDDRPRDFSRAAGFDPQAPDFANTPSSDRRPEFDYAPASSEQVAFVSIVTPFHDTGPEFEETARSIERQSFQQWEWIIVDDGSTDPAALDRLARVVAAEPRARVVRQENAGPGAARNRGYREARTDYVVHVDADDLVEPTAIEKWLWFLISYPEYAIAKSYSIGFGSHEYVWTKGFHEPAEFLNRNITTITGMVRRETHERVGGFDEVQRAGLEDWDFWMRCAAAGRWGGTIPEPLEWYRRRDSHSDRWRDWDGESREASVRAELKRRYPELWAAGMPVAHVEHSRAWQDVSDELPCANALVKRRRRVLMIIPWMTMGGSDRFTLDLVEQLVRRGFEVSIATTLHGANPWKHEFERFTPDVFVLENFLRDADFPRFLRYLIESRDIDTVLVTHSLLGYMLLPYLRSRCPQVTYVDYCHAETPEWLNGGYPRFAVGHHDTLDLDIVSSEHLKRWMVDRGADPERIEVCYTSIDCEAWRPDPDARAAIRREFDIPGDRVVLLYAVRICDQKQPKVFARTMELLRRSGQDFTAIVAGDGPDRPWLESFLSRRGLTDRVRTIGPVSAGRVKDLMAASDILFLPSKLEGIALSLFEAMATGLVVVAADVGGQRELVTPDTGILLDRSSTSDEAASYAEILTRLIASRAERERLAANAYERVRHGFDLSTMGDRMVALFEQAAQARREDPHPPIPLRHGLECAAMATEYTRVDNLAAHLWQTREERLGLATSWRTRLWNIAVGVHGRLPPRLQRMAVGTYRRLFVRRT